MLKDFRKKYWKARDEGRASSYIFKRFLFILLFICIIAFAFLLGTRSGNKNKNETHVEKQSDEESSIMESSEETTEDPDDYFDWDPNKKDVTNETESEEEATEDLDDDIELERISSLSYIMSEDVYPKFEEELKNKCINEGFEKAELLKFEEFEEEGYFFTDYVCLSSKTSEKIVRVEYYIKSNIYKMEDTELTREYVETIQAQKEAEAEAALQRAQEEQSSIVAEERESIWKEQVKEYYDVTTNIKNKKKYKLSKKVKITASGGFKSIKLNGNNIKFNEGDTEKEFKLKTYKKKLKKKGWNKLVIEDEFGNTLEVKFKIKKLKKS